MSAAVSLIAFGSLLQQGKGADAWCSLVGRNGPDSTSGSQRGVVFLKDDCAFCN